MESNSRIYVAGNTGMVGSAIIRMLTAKGYTNIISSPSGHWDLRRQDEVERFFRINNPEYVFLAAAKVGGELSLCSSSLNVLIVFHPFSHCMQNKLLQHYPN